MLKLKLYSFLVFIIFIAGGILLFDYIFLYKRIVLASYEITRAKRELQYLQGRIAYFPLIKSEERRMEEKKDELKALPSFSNGLEFFYFLEETARDSGNEISITIEEGKEKRFRVKLAGSFNNIMGFLLRLENKPVETELKELITVKQNQKTYSLVANIIVASRIPL